jgi:hypothetical protein
MSFIRVRAVDGPRHEFDAPTGEVEAHPDLYVIVDKTVVEQPREPKYVTTPKKAAPKRATKPAAPKAAPKPSVGETNEEGV